MPPAASLQLAPPDTETLKLAPPESLPDGVKAALVSRPDHENRGLRSEEIVHVRCETEARTHRAGAAVAVSFSVHNSLDAPLEIKIDVPLLRGAAVLGMTATVGDVTVSSRVKARSQAAADYDDAIASGRRAFKLDATRRGASVYAGNLDPGLDAVVTVRYATPPAFERAGDRWFAFLGCGAQESVLRVDGREFSGSGDQVVFAPGAAATPGAWLAGGGALTATVLPQSGNPDAPEVVVVADCSGSMNSYVPQLRRALAAVIDALPDGTRFQLVWFGTAHRALFAAPTALDPARRAAALQAAAETMADMGGTQLHEAIVAATAAAPESGWRSVVVLTDGYWSEPERTKQLATRRQGDTRFSCVGIGSGADLLSLQGLAFAGRGDADVCPDDDVGRAAAVAEGMARAALAPVVRGARLRLGGFVADMPVLPVGAPTTVCLLLEADGDGDGDGDAAVLEAADGAELWRARVERSAEDAGEAACAAAAELARLEAVAGGEEAVRDFALAHGLASSQTSFACSVVGPSRLAAGAMQSVTLADCDSDSDDEDYDCGCGVGGSAPDVPNDGPNHRRLRAAAAAAGPPAAARPVDSPFGFLAVAPRPEDRSGDPIEALFTGFLRGPRNSRYSCWLSAAAAMLAAVPGLREQLSPGMPGVLGALVGFLEAWARPHSLRSSFKRLLRKRGDALRAALAADGGFSPAQPDDPGRAVSFVLAAARRQGLRLGGARLVPGSAGGAAVAVLAREQVGPGEFHFACVAWGPRGEVALLDDTLNLCGELFQGGVLAAAAVPRVVPFYESHAVLSLVV